MDHPVFGPIEATIDHANGHYFWETPLGVNTEKGEIGVFFDAPSDGPSAAQVAMWHQILSDSDRLSQKAEPLLRDRLLEFGWADRYGELKWSAVGLSTDGSVGSDWDMSFSIPEAIFTVYFKHGMPETVSCDS